jgi:hypothetical protein
MAADSSRGRGAKEKMPNLREHHRHDAELFGKEIAEKYKFVHQILDSAQPALQQSHRKYFHDAKTVQFITWMYGPIAGFIAAEHLRFDKERTALNRQRWNRRK